MRGATDGMCFCRGGRRDNITHDGHTIEMTGAIVVVAVVEAEARHDLDCPSHWFAKAAVGSQREHLHRLPIPVRGRASNAEWHHDMPPHRQGVIDVKVFNDVSLGDGRQCLRWQVAMGAGGKGTDGRRFCENPVGLGPELQRLVDV